MIIQEGGVRLLDIYRNSIPDILTSAFPGLFIRLLVEVKRKIGTLFRNMFL